jgi:hypothetical protein
MSYTQLACKCHQTILIFSEAKVCFLAVPPWLEKSARVLSSICILVSNQIITTGEMLFFFFLNNGRNVVDLH